MNTSTPYWIDWDDTNLMGIVKQQQNEINKMNEERAHCPDERNLMEWDRHYGHGITRRQGEIDLVRSELKRRKA